MKIFLVGGAVRDSLLNIPIKERDWVVVGATQNQMLKLGFKKVGKNFPVFLHPKTHEEYALARIDRKIGKGYTEFSCYSSPKVTLEEDLKRRDLTINAMAQDVLGNIIDPFRGQLDIKKHLLRHVSESFAEDPVRILRVARFASKFGDFTVHHKTNILMKLMLINGEIDYLVPERVWQEFSRALREKYPERFFIVLNDCEVLDKIFPEFAKNLTPVITTLKKITPVTDEGYIRFAAITYHLTKKEICNFCCKYKIPKIYKDLALLVNKINDTIVNMIEDPNEIVNFLENFDVYRRPNRIKNALLAIQINNNDISYLISRIFWGYKITKEIKLTTKSTELKSPNIIHKIIHNTRKIIIEEAWSNFYVTNSN